MIPFGKLKRFVRITVNTLIALCAILAGVVTFGVAPAPLNEALVHMDSTGLPPLSWYRARDGAMLAYRAYQDEGAQVAALIHGSTGQSQETQFAHPFFGQKMAPQSW